MNAQTAWDREQASSWLSQYAKVYEDSGREGYEIRVTDLAAFVASVREQLAQRIDREAQYEKAHATSGVLVRGLETAAKELRREPRPTSATKVEP